ncbi:unnamed protein product [Discosporangium mesarthrocarpum]
MPSRLKTRLRRRFSTVSLAASLLVGFSRGFKLPVSYRLSREVEKLGTMRGINAYPAVPGKSGLYPSRCQSADIVRVVGVSRMTLSPPEARVRSTEKPCKPTKYPSSIQLPTEEPLSTSRGDFLRQGVLAAMALSVLGGSGLLDLSPARAGAGKEMVWLGIDADTLAKRQSVATETYPEEFVAYLTRFLLNFDEECRLFFDEKLGIASSREESRVGWETFEGLVASVGFGLDRFPGPDGTRDLCSALSHTYMGRSDNGSADQLAVLFSLLPPSVQPVSSIRALLTTAAGTRDSAAVAADGVGSTHFAAITAVNQQGRGKTVEVDVDDLFRENPTALLPDSLRPLYNTQRKAFDVPEVTKYLREVEGVGAFGPRGIVPIYKERSLSAFDFGLFAACGAVGCTATHAAVIPLDVVKTRLQTQPGRYRGLTEGVVTIAREEGLPMLLQGLGPTLGGYLWYGVTVYPGYELFKRLYMSMVGPIMASTFRVPLVLAAGATATVVACFGVCPAEAVRIRQVADPSVGGFGSALRQIVRESGWGKMYESFPPILFRQVSFGMVKFLVFDYFSDFVYSVLPILAEQTSTQLSVSLLSGLVAGVAAAIVSQPADTVLSTMNRDSGRKSIAETWRDIVSERGIGGLFLGLQSRIVWSGAIISGQFLLYDVCKSALHVRPDDLRLYLDVLTSVKL